MICTLGSSRCLFWQLLPQTVVFRYSTVPRRGSNLCMTST